MSLVTDVFTTTIVEQVVEPTLSPLSVDGGASFTQVNLIHDVTEVITSSILVSPPTTSTSRAASTSTSFLSKSKSASVTPSASSNAVAAAVPTTTAAASASASVTVGSSSADVSSTALPSGIKAASEQSASASAVASQSSGLPAGAIAGIVIGVVLLLNVIGVLLYRRRALAKRRARRATWRAGVKALALPAALDVEKTAGVHVAPAHTSPFMLGLPGRNSRGHNRARSDGSPESQYSLPSALTRSPDPSVSRDGVAGRARSASPTRRPSGSRAAPERPPRAATRKSPPTVNQSLPPQSAHNQPGSAGPRTALATPAAAQVPTAVVRVTFIPTRADELSIAIGQTLAVLHAFDDGWALCQNAYGEQGMAPLECLEGGGGLFKGFGGHDARGMMSSKSKRRSSLAPPPQSGRYPRYP